MIVGDSISAGPGCYKKYLRAELDAGGYGNLEFVGEYDDDCGGNVKHSAVSCSTAEQYTHESFTMPNCFQGKIFPGLSTLMSRYRPDVVMLQLGVNDVWNGAPTAEIIENYSKLAAQARAQNETVVLFTALIQRFRPDCTDDAAMDRAATLVAAVPAWASRLSTPKSPVFVADLWTDSDWTKAETVDCVHPNDAGARRMARSWYLALEHILKRD